MIFLYFFKNNVLKYETMISSLKYMKWMIFCFQTAQKGHVKDDLICKKID